MLLKATNYRTVAMFYSTGSVLDKNKNRKNIAHKPNKHFIILVLDWKQFRESRLVPWLFGVKC
jgi:hypothetical protein